MYASLEIINLVWWSFILSGAHLLNLFCVRMFEDLFFLAGIFSGVRKWCVVPNTIYVCAMHAGTEVKKCDVDTPLIEYLLHNKLSYFRYISVTAPRAGRHIDSAVVRPLLPGYRQREHHQNSLKVALPLSHRRAVSLPLNWNWVEVVDRRQYAHNTRGPDAQNSNSFSYLLPTAGPGRECCLAATVRWYTPVDCVASLRV